VAADLLLGISDSDAPTVVETHWDGLGVSHARVVVPFDVAVSDGPAGTRRRELFEQYRDNARLKGVSLLVAFEASADRSGGAVAPGVEAYEAALRSFVERYPEVAAIAAWNEPNNRQISHYALGNDPRLAAEYWLRARATAPPGTDVVAGSFAGIPGDAYVGAYKRHLRRARARPDVWAFHAHSDINAFQERGDRSARISRWYLGQLNRRFSDCRIWIDEIGARYRDATGRIWGDDSQAEATAFLLDLARLDPRIDALYYYNYSNQCSVPARCAIQDRGLVSPAPFNGEAPDYDARDRPRSAYDVFAAGGR
jgi:hypothetical protein